MATWTPTTKNSSTFTPTSKFGSEVIYLVSEALDFYLVGSSEDETLVAQDLIAWSALTKN